MARVMLALLTLSLLLPPLVGLALAGSARIAAMHDAQRQCRGYW